MNRFIPFTRTAALALILGSIPAFGQSAADYQALENQLRQLQAQVNKLQREQADMTVNYSGTAPAPTIEQSKVQLGSGVTDLKLFGDLRFRYQYDQFHPVVDVPPIATTDRNRYLFRLRIGADAQLGDQFFAGIVLATGPAADSNSVTYTEGYDNYSIYIDKAFAGWTPTDWLTIILGKQANPFYTTDLVWGPAINPAGAVEVLDLSKALWPDYNRFSLQLISMQGVFENGASFSTGADTAFQFVEQLKGTYHFNKDTSITFAPGFMTYTAASLSGLQNAQPFTKPSDALTAASGVQTQTTVTNTQTQTIKYDSTGKPAITLTPVNQTTTVTTTEPATGAVRSVTTETSNNQTQVTIPFGAKGNDLKQNAKLANETFVTTKTLGGGSTTVTSPVGKEPAEETKDLAIITAPGDFSFRLGSVPTKIFWDFAYNTEGSARATNEYFLTSHSSRDNLAWLAGVQVGQNKQAGDWSAYADYRQVGMDSIDPNINDNYFALSYLNVQGINLGVAYNITNSLVGAITYFKSWQLRQGILGGEATGGANLANGKSVDVLQMDVNLKF